jgi:hypothetical protein
MSYSFKVTQIQREHFLEARSADDFAIYDINLGRSVF